MTNHDFAILALLFAVTNAMSIFNSGPHQKREKGQIASPECHLRVPTDIWTTCSDVLNTYHISLSYFVQGNAGLSQDCGGFSPGEAYCVALAVERPLMKSNDSRCGNQRNWTNTCVGSTYGNCWYVTLFAIYQTLPCYLKRCWVLQNTKRIDANTCVVEQ